MLGYHFQRYSWGTLKKKRKNFPDLSVQCLYLYATASVHLSEGGSERQKEGEGVEKDRARKG